MMLHLFSVYDRAVGAFLPPFTARTKSEAIRSFSEACNDEKHQFRKHASDYSLFFVGTFDDGGASFGLPTAPERVVTAAECIAEEDVFPPEKQLDRRMPM